MKLTDFLEGAGRPVAYYPGLRRVTGSTTATLFLCQLIYWKGKEADPDGWIYKTSDDMETETGLSYEEQKSARARLRESGLIEEYYARLDHQMRYRVNYDKLNTEWGKGESPAPEQGNATMGKRALPFSLNDSETTTEITAEIEIDSETSKIEAAPGPAPDPVIAWIIQHVGIGAINARTADDLRAWRDEDRHSDEWILKALEDAKSRGIGKAGLLSYANQVLISWRANGYPPTRAEQVQKARRQAQGVPGRAKQTGADVHAGLELWLAKKEAQAVVPAGD